MSAQPDVKNYSGICLTWLNTATKKDAEILIGISRNIFLDVTSQDLEEI
jgi:hypothetical protein